MTRTKQATADRRNSNKRAGMKKRAGRGWTVLKARRPEPTSEFLAAPGEDAGAYRDRLIAWTGDLGPRNRVELYLVEQAVRLSWQLDRADRAGSSLLSESTRLVRDPASADATIRIGRLDSVESESGDCLRRHQLACGRMLLRTLETLVGLRQAWGAAESDGVVASLRLADDPPGGKQTDPIRSGDESIEAAAATDRAPSGGSPRPIRDESESPAALCDARDVLVAAADPPDLPGRARPSMRRRAPKRRARQTDWQVSSGPGTRGPDSDPKVTTARREPRSPEASSDRSEARRRVGGYAVPLDPSVPVSFADRIPVRLRRQSAAARPSRAASFPAE
jgi:hypothetical protein